MRVQAIECGRLTELLLAEKERERTLSSEMDTRAAKQLLLNAIGVVALAYGGYGIAYSVRGEGQRRDDLRESRAEVEAMAKVLADKSCRPDANLLLPEQKPVTDSSTSVAPAAPTLKPTTPTPDPAPEPK